MTSASLHLCTSPTANCRSLCTLNASLPHSSYCRTFLQLRIQTCYLLSICMKPIHHKKIKQFSQSPSLQLLSLSAVKFYENPLISVSIVIENLCIQRTKRSDRTGIPLRNSCAREGRVTAVWNITNKIIKHRGVAILATQAVPTELNIYLTSHFLISSRCRQQTLMLTHFLVLYTLHSVTHFPSSVLTH